MSPYDQRRDPRRSAWRAVAEDNLAAWLLLREKYELALKLLHQARTSSERPATRLPAGTFHRALEASGGPQEPAQPQGDLRMELVDLAWGENLLFADGWDDCIIGVALVWDSSGARVDRVVYDMEAMLEQLEAEGLDPEEAAEHISFNVEGAYVGLQTPIFVRRVISGG